MPQHKKFNEFAKETLPLDGAKLRLDAVLNKEILVIGFKVRTSKYKRDESSECLTLQFMLENNRYVLFTGSRILIDQITKYQTEIPFLTTIKKIDKYYTFS
jgi:hypothetical protein